MHISYRPAQRQDKPKAHQAGAGFNEKQYLRYQKLGEKIDIRLNCCKNGSDIEMIENFYLRLFPVTIRDWASSKQ